MSRSGELQEFLDNIMLKTFGRTNTDAVKQSICVRCGEPATEFRDEINRKEYHISGYCQTCQDKIFVPPEEETEENV